MQKRMLIMAAALIVVFGALFGTKRMMDSSQQYNAPPPATVATAFAKQESWDKYITAIGTIGAVNDIAIRNEVDGTVKFNANSTAYVEKGELLLELDDEVEQARLRSLLSQLKLAQINFDRDNKLLGRQLTSREQLDKSQAELADIKAQVEATRAIIARKKVFAPFAGKVGINPIAPGQYLPSGTDIASLISVNNLYVKFSVPEHQLPKVEPGQVLSFTVDAYPDQTFHATVYGVDAMVDVNTRNFRVLAGIEDSEGLIPGMFAAVTLQLSKADEVVSVPVAAIGYSLYGETLYLVESTEKGLAVQQKYIKTGRRNGNFIAVTEGIKPGDQVVTEGQLKLFSGSLITVANSTAAATAE